MANVYLFFDTETTGLPGRGRPDPELVQLAAKLVSEDRVVRGAMNVIVYPDGWTIPAEASNIHHITNEIAHSYGIPRRAAISVFSNMCRQATHAVAHNFDFDRTIISAALERERAPNRLVELVPICTMKASTDFVAIKRHGGGNKYPKLSDAYAHYFDGATFGNAHDAMADLEAMERVFWEMKRRGHIVTTEVARAAAA